MQKVWQSNLVENDESETSNDETNKQTWFSFLVFELDKPKVKSANAEEEKDRSKSTYLGNHKIDKWHRLLQTCGHQSDGRGILTAFLAAKKEKYNQEHRHKQTKSEQEHTYSFKNCSMSCCVYCLRSGHEPVFSCATGAGAEEEEEEEEEEEDANSVCCRERPTAR